MLKVCVGKQAKSILIPNNKTNINYRFLVVRKSRVKKAQNSMYLKSYKSTGKNQAYFKGF